MRATEIFPVLFLRSGGRSAPKTRFVTDSPTCSPGTVSLIDAILTGIDRVVKTRIPGPARFVLYARTGFATALCRL